MRNQFGVSKQTCLVYLHGFDNENQWLAVRDIAERVPVTRDAIKRAIFNLERAGLLQAHSVNAFIEPSEKRWRRKDEGELDEEQRTIFERIVSAGKSFGSNPM